MDFRKVTPETINYTRVYGRPSLFRIDSVHQIDFSFPRFVGLLVLSLWIVRTYHNNFVRYNISYVRGLKLIIRTAK
jgi:hypothetical protein